MENVINNFGLNLSLVVRVTRNITLEREEIQGINRPAAIIARRNTNPYDMPMRNLPFGLRGRHRQPLRGRKRTAANMAVHAVLPNVDGRLLTNMPPTTPASALPSHPTTTPTPPNLQLNIPIFTYARAARAIVRRLTFPPSSPPSPSTSQAI